MSSGDRPKNWQNLQVRSKVRLSIVANRSPKFTSLWNMTELACQVARTTGDFRGLFNGYTSAPDPPRAPFFWVV